MHLRLSVRNRFCLSTTVLMFGSLGSGLLVNSVDSGSVGEIGFKEVDSLIAKNETRSDMESKR